MNITRRLTHRCVYSYTTNGTPNEFGDFVSVTSTATMACYAYQGMGQDVIGQRISLKTDEYAILLPGSLTTVSEGDLLVDIRDLGNNQIHPQLRIRQVMVFGRYLAKRRDFHLAIAKVN